jgi:hypothetical protein
MLIIPNLDFLLLSILSKHFFSRKKRQTRRCTELEQCLAMFDGRNGFQVSYPTPGWECCTGISSGKCSPPEEIKQRHSFLFTFEVFLTILLFSFIVADGEDVTPNVASEIPSCRPSRQRTAVGSCYNRLHTRFMGNASKKNMVKHVSGLKLTAHNDFR